MYKQTNKQEMMLARLLRRLRRSALLPGPEMDAYARDFKPCAPFEPRTANPCMVDLRSAVFTLGQEGYTIEGSPSTGFNLVSEPRQFNAMGVMSYLDQDMLGWPFLYFPETDSTNTQLKRMAALGAAHGTCLMADFQNAGRGRLNRTWLAQPGQGLLFSVLFRPPAALNQAFHFTALMGLSVCYALERLGFKPQIKWPNDIYLNDAKLCGMLSELGVNEAGLDYLVVGIGVNVNQVNFAHIPQAVTSLARAGGRRCNRTKLLAAILNQAGRLYSAWQADHTCWLAAYRERSWLLGRQVVVRDEAREYEGRAFDFAEDGSLLLLGDNNDTISVSHGDVSILAIDGQYRR